MSENDEYDTFYAIGDNRPYRLYRDGRIAQPIGVALEGSENGVVRVVTRGIVRVRDIGIVDFDNGMHFTEEGLKKAEIKSKDSSKVRKPTRKEWRRIIDV